MNKPAQDSNVRPLRPKGPEQSVRDALIEQLSAPVSNSVRWTRWIAGGLFLAIVILAAVVPISSGAVATGQLAPDISRQLIQHPAGGVVREILVREGQQVEAGDLLVRLDAVEESASATAADSEVVGLRAEEAVRRAEILRHDVVDLPEDLRGEFSDPILGEIVAAQVGAFHARRAQAAAQRQQIAARRLQVRAQVQASEAQELATTEQVVRVNSELEGYYRLLERGFIARTRVLAAERMQADLIGRVSSHRAEQARLLAEDSELAARYAQVALDVQAQAAEALRDVQARLVQASARRSVAHSRMDRTEMRAPVSGAVMELRANTVGGVVGPGDPIMQIVPDRGRLIVRARVSPSDADDVRRGALAVVRFNTISSRAPPRLRGEVETISADAIMDERTGLSYFEARIAVPAHEVRRLPPDAYAPGLPVEVLIRTGSRTIVSYLFAPIEGAAFRAMREQ